MAHTCVLATQEAKIRRIMVQSQQGKQFTKLYLKKCQTHKRTGGVSQIVECLPRKPELDQAGLPSKF
jgi:hypothetical protein